ncbi:MAG TPA: STAS domain-containing protein [Victivallales bacterium]|nr:STAS domain-containing protein [Victivallales bacterium]
MSVNCTNENGKVICHFTARKMDFITTRDCEDSVLRSIKDAESVVFDLAEVAYISSSFLRLCLIASKEMKGKMSIVNVAKSVLNVFKLAGMIKILNITT